MHESGIFLDFCQCFAPCDSNLRGQICVVTQPPLAERGDATAVYNARLRHEFDIS